MIKLVHRPIVPPFDDSSILYERTPAEGLFYLTTLITAVMRLP